MIRREPVRRTAPLSGIILPPLIALALHSALHIDRRNQKAPARTDGAAILARSISPSQPAAGTLMTNSFARNALVLGQAIRDRCQRFGLPYIEEGLLRGK